MDHAQDPEQGKLRKAASDGAQAAVWVVSLIVLALLLAAGIAWGLSHRLSPHAPDLRPELPTLPGKPPEPVGP